MVKTKQVAIAVCDIGKTNAKVCAVTTAGTVGYVATCPFASLPGPPYLHLDTAGIWAWLCDQLALCAQQFAIAKVVVCAHGATCALLADDDLALPVLDYEDPAPDACEPDYAAVRPPFAETLSPPLPGSLNYGRGIFWVATTYPAEFAQVNCIVNYAQYWSFRLSGVAAHEVTSIGSHSDLWMPRQRRYSSLATRYGWDKLFPELSCAGETLGPVSAQVAATTGLSPDCQVLCGIHDSNAALLPWLDDQQPFTLCSTGTWIINLALGSALDALDPQRDCAANVSIRGEPIACTRWMGGREFANLGGTASNATNLAALRECLARQLMFLPPQGGQGGLFQHHQVGRSCNVDATTPTRLRAAAASLYCALVQDSCLDLSSPQGPLIIAGPFAGNKLFTTVLATLRPRQQVMSCPDESGVSFDAARLALPDLPRPQLTAIAPLDDAPELDAYRRQWRHLANRS